MRKGRSRRFLLIALAVVFSIVGGCHSPGRTASPASRRAEKRVEAVKEAKSLLPDDISWSEHGLHNRFARYVARFSDEARQLFSGDDWIVENFDCITDYGTRACRFERKRGTAYFGNILVDRDSDGTVDKERGYFFDLRLASKKDNGIIWISTDEIPATRTGTALSVFLDNYVESLTGSELNVEGDPLGYAVVKERKFATRLDTSAETKLGPFDAVTGTVSVMDLDKLKVDSNDVHSRIKILLARVECDKVRRLKNSLDVDLSYETSGKALLVAGYMNSPKQFDAGLTDFNQLLERISFENIAAPSSPK
ncbi:MAG: hypothetical protein PHU25_13665 [Deltaproteobacteria bacterium]|nr:hypothetical protein [Deltaproteobacteria bacterium]